MRPDRESEPTRPDFLHRLSGLYSCGSLWEGMMRKWKFNPEWVNRYKYKLEFFRRSNWFEEIKEKTKKLDKKDKKMIFELAQELLDLKLL